MAVPKRKTSQAKSHQRRAANFKLSAPTLGKCPNCNEPKLAHRVCGACGYYNGKQVIDVAE
jgi:large subunit ribosomal protein L32